MSGLVLLLFGLLVVSAINAFRYERIIERSRESSRWVVEAGKKMKVSGLFNDDPVAMLLVEKTEVLKTANELQGNWLPSNYRQFLIASTGSLLFFGFLGQEAGLIFFSVYIAVFTTGALKFWIGLFSHRRGIRSGRIAMSGPALKLTVNASELLAVSYCLNFFLGEAETSERMLTVEQDTVIRAITSGLDKQLFLYGIPPILSISDSKELPVKIPISLPVDAASTLGALVRYLQHAVFSAVDEKTVSRKTIEIIGAAKTLVEKLPLPNEAA